MKLNLLRALTRGNDQEDLFTPDFQLFGDHAELSDRIRKTLYYGKLPSTDRPSMALTEISVEVFSAVLPNDGLKILDMQYASTVSRKACITPCSMMLAMVYLDQLRHKNPNYMNSVASCDVFLVSMLVASKFLYDDGEDDEVFNNEWAASGDLELKDLNVMEREFLDALDWHLFVKPKTFSDILDSIESRIAHLESSQRGWTTYTDICVLSKGPVLERCWLLIFDGVLKVIAVSAIAYVAAVLTLFGSAVLVHKVTQTSHQLFQCTSLGPEPLLPGQPRNASHVLPPCAVPPALAAADELPEECLPPSPPGLLPRALSCQHHSKRAATVTNPRLRISPPPPRACSKGHRIPISSTAGCVGVTYSL